MKRFPACCLALILPVGAVIAEPVVLDDPSACTQVLSEPEGVLDFAAGGGLILGAGGYNSLEYSCTFQPPIDFDRAGNQASSHAGHCALPGPQYFPQMFTIVADPAVPGQIAVWTGEAEPLRFYVCDS